MQLGESKYVIAGKLTGQNFSSRFCSKSQLIGRQVQRRTEGNILRSKSSCSVEVQSSPLKNKGFETTICQIFSNSRPTQVYTARSNAKPERINYIFQTQSDRQFQQGCNDYSRSKMGKNKFEIKFGDAHLANLINTTSVAVHPSLPTALRPFRNANSWSTVSGHWPATRQPPVICFDARQR